MSDYYEIASLLSRLGMTFDDQDASAAAECWAEDAVLRFTPSGGTMVETQGRDAIVASLKAAWASGNIRIRHFVGTPDIRLNGDEASVRYYTLYPTIDAEPRMPGFGSYRTQVRRDPDGAWRVLVQELVQHSRAEGDFAR